MHRSVTDKRPLRIEVRRDGILEAVHEVAYALVDERGDLAEWAGDPRLVTTLRSSAKPLQAVPAVLHPGFPSLNVSTEELAIACASHTGEARPAALAASLLALSGYVPDDLVCGPAGNPPACLKHGCSGNHAAILLIAKLLGADLPGYEKPDHPAQKAILAQIRDMSRCTAIAIATDGCGIPTFGMPLWAMARAFGSLTTPTASWSAIPEAMAAHSDLIGYPGWMDVRVMHATRGDVIAKTGAEGLLCLGRRGHGMAVKCLDGSDRPMEEAVRRILSEHAWIAPETIV